MITITLLRVWRRRLENRWAEVGDAARHPDYRGGKGSTGLCFSSIYWMVREAEKVGVDRSELTLVQATNSSACPRHTWLRYRGYDIDLTADQFGFSPVIFVREREHPGGSGRLRSWPKSMSPHHRALL